MPKGIVDYNKSLQVDTTGTSAIPWENLLYFFPALRHKNFRTYIIGLFVSISGGWLQIVVLGWLVLKLTNSAFLVGLTTALGSLPILFFGLFAGVVVDRFDKKRIIFITQVFSMILAFVLGLLTILNTINIYEIFILSFASGIILAIDHPARQAFTIELVEKEDLTSAIALTSAVFNSARMVGPAAAGFVIATFSLGGAFIINSLTFLAFLAVLLVIKTEKLPFASHSHPIEALKEGVVYSFSHKIIRTLLIFGAVSAIFGWSYLTIMPVVVQNVFLKGADTLGYFYSAFGAGALFGVVFTSWLARKFNFLLFILGGASLFSISLILFSFTTNQLIALMLLFISAFGLLLQFTMINSTIQHLVENRLRGRVMSVYSFMFLGMAPFGSFQIGFITEHFTSQFALRLGALIIMIFVFLIYIKRTSLQDNYKKYMTKASF